MTQTTPNDEQEDATHISAQNTDAVETPPSTDGPANSTPLGDVTTSEFYVNKTEEDRTYQDDLDYHDEQTDPIIDEVTDDPSDGFQIPRDEFKKEMDNIELDDLERDNEDMRETIEDQDENDGNSASLS